MNRAAGIPIDRPRRVMHPIDVHYGSLRCRHGRQSVRLVPIVPRVQGLPCLGAFRASMTMLKTGFIETVIAFRREERYSFGSGSFSRR